ncbi:LacI family DNA-binding transcriptional regulator [Serratia entomophila]|uniref:LacI family DNA-binding transcriptional regulator n=1 Tax=Serratia entomophila TaxID=42906 RepID=UPI002178B057|nr:substrate-binding domain-containing protein [Serratia entomophila]CAI0932198.1 Purine nucleotide synthesis repressor [Serratia entomophila]CAI0934966.1 Purine nucleotide synthesis repressor [Serratia entomophila]CAI0939384.1 Purine nucleotide synthesis repressor [Serratia entomophila]CAI0958230.1 Purine nucleotide synthesis repressor [Serratia entomophila]CAI1623076.1 Purine nucleotide synthesis repressor [Serratia entomophila]
MENSDKPVTLKALAARLGMHVSTISRVLNGSQDDASLAAAPETVLRIRQLAAELNYRPNPHATSLKTQRSQVIGVLVPRLSDLVLATIYEGIDEAAAQNRIFTFVSNTHDQPAIQQERGEMALARRVDGLIIGDAHITSDNHFLANIAARGVPFVLVSRRAGDYFSVTCDDYRGGQLAAQHLIEQGHRRIAIIAGEPFASTGLDRTAGFIDYCLQAGVEIPDSWVISSHFDTLSGHQAGLKLLSGPRPPSAVFAVNDFLAIGLMGAARDRGLTPGLNIAIVGFNDTPLAAQLPIALSSIRSPMREMGYRAVELLLQRMKGKAAGSLRLEPSLIVRDSSLYRFSEKY